MEAHFKSPCSQLCFPNSSSNRPCLPCPGELSEGVLKVTGQRSHGGHGILGTAWAGETRSAHASSIACSCHMPRALPAHLALLYDITRDKPQGLLKPSYKDLNSKSSELSELSLLPKGCIRGGRSVSSGVKKPNMQRVWKLEWGWVQLVLQKDSKHPNLSSQEECMRMSPFLPLCQHYVILKNLISADWAG